MYDLIELAKEARRVRDAQVQYFKTRDDEELVSVKIREKEFDDILSKIPRERTIGEPDELTRERLAELVASVAGIVIGGLGFSFTWNSDKAVEGYDRAEVISGALALEAAAEEILCGTGIRERRDLVSVSTALEAATEGIKRC